MIKEHRYRRGLRNFARTGVAMIMGVLILSTGLRAQDNGIDVSGDIFNASVNPLNVNHNAEFEIQFDVGGGPPFISISGNPNLILGGESQFILTFTTQSGGINYDLPEDINTSDVLINNQPAGEVEVTGNELVVTPATDANNEELSLSLKSSADILHPSEITDYQIVLETEDANTGLFSDEPPVGDVSYTLQSSNTTISQPSVTPNPSVEEDRASYTVNFSLGAGGALPEESEITLDFPDIYDLPAGIINGVTLNDNSVEAIGNSDNTVSVFTDQQLSNNESVEIRFSTEGTGIENPLSGTYTIDVFTEVESTAVTSTQIDISSVDNLSFSSVDPIPDRVNNPASYTIEFNTSEEGALQSGSDRIVLTFPDEADLPGSISTSRVTITAAEEGFTGNPANVEVDGRQITLIPAVTIADEDNVSITIDDGAGIINPSEPGNYQLQAETRENDGSIIDEERPSNSFAITPAESSVSDVAVALDDIDPFETTNYHLEFATGEFGRLVEQTNTISVRFPNGTGLTDGQNIDVQVTGFQNSSSVSQNDLEIGENGRILTFTVPESVSSSQIITFSIEGVDNPPEGSYSIDTKTSAENEFKSSGLYEIGGEEIEIEDEITITNDEVNQVSPYEIDFANVEFSGTAFLTITFPEGTRIPDDIETNDITPYMESLEGNDPEFEGVNLLDDNRSVRLELSAEPYNVFWGIIAPSVYEIHSIDFQQSAGITNPSIPDTDYSLTASTSANPNSVESLPFDFNSRDEAPGLVDIEITPAVANLENVRHEFTFQPGPNGRLIGGTAAGSNMIDIRFPEQYDLPAEIDASEVDVKGSTPGSVEVGLNEGFPGADRTVRIEVPSGVTIEGEDEAAIIFGSSAGIDTPEISDPTAISEEFDFSVRSDAQHNFSPDVSATLQAELDLSFTDITIGDKEANATSSYNFDFLLGSGDTVNEGDPITLTFPENTSVPDGIATSRILVDGTHPDQPADDAGEYAVEVLSPKTLSEGNEYTVSISSNAGILNPSLTGSDYRAEISVGTSSVQSPSYTITEATSSISQPKVALIDPNGESPNAPGSPVNYNITFQTGANGRLIPGESTITLEFPNTNIFDEGDPDVAINGSDLGSVSPDDAQSLSVDVPQNIQISNSGEVDLMVDNLTNPLVADDYTLQAYTSIESSPVSSESYTIGSESLEIAGIVLGGMGENLAGNEAIVNDTSVVTFTFNPAELIGPENITFDIQFPEDIQFPSSLQGNNVIEYEDDEDNLHTLGADDITLSRSDRSISFEVSEGTQEGISSLTITGDMEIRNPREPNTYEYEVSTDVQSVPASAEVIYLPAAGQYLAEAEQQAISLISDTPLTVERTTFDPVETDIPVKWRMRFTTGDLGRLRPQASTIHIDFPEEEEALGKCITFTETDIQQSDIKVQGVGVTNVQIDEENLQMTLTLAPGVTVSSNRTIVVDIEKEAGIQYTECSQSQGRYTTQQIQQTEDDDDYNLSTSSETDGTNTLESEPLPVEMEEFLVEPNSAGYARLQWITATERENDGFRVERRFPESEEEGVWEKLIFIDSKAGGTTTEQQEYEFLDDELSGAAGEYEYRLVQEDFDGTETVFGPLIFEFEGPQHFELAQNYPNPFNPVTTIPFDVPEQTDVTLEVFNIIGERVTTLVDETKEPGTYTVDFDGSRLASGVYIVRMQAGGVMETMQITLVK